MRHKRVFQIGFLGVAIGFFAFSLYFVNNRKIVQNDPVAGGGSRTVIMQRRLQAIVDAQQNGNKNYSFETGGMAPYGSYFQNDSKK